MAEYKKFARPSRSVNHGPSRPASRPHAGGFGGPKELHDAECNSCHKRCQVPFRPNGKKPVYCADCFSKNDSRDSRDSQRPSYRSDARPERSFAKEVPDRQLEDLKREVQAMNATLQNLVTAVDTFNRATALTLEIQKHFPAEKAQGKASEKTVEKKKVAAKAKTTKVAAKK